MAIRFITAGKGKSNKGLGKLLRPVAMRRLFVKPFAFDDTTKEALSWWGIRSDGVVVQVNSYNYALGGNNAPRAYPDMSEADLLAKMTNGEYKELKSPDAVVTFPAVNEAGEQIEGQVKWPPFATMAAGTTTGSTTPAPGTGDQSDDEDEDEEVIDQA